MFWEVEDTLSFEGLTGLKASLLSCWQWQTRHHLFFTALGSYCWGEVRFKSDLLSLLKTNVFFLTSSSSPSSSSPCSSFPRKWLPGGQREKVQGRRSILPWLLKWAPGSTGGSQGPRLPGRTSFAPCECSRCTGEPPHLPAGRTETHLWVIGGRLPTWNQVPKSPGCIVIRYTERYMLLHGIQKRRACHPHGSAAHLPSLNSQLRGGVSGSGYTTSAAGASLRGHRKCPPSRGAENFNMWTDTRVHLSNLYINNRNGTVRCD